MQDVDRGKIRNKQAATVIRDMSKLRWGNITPTDIDAFLDFGDKLFVIIEVKYGGHTMPHGQELALSRLCAATHSAARTAVAVQAMYLDRHLTEDEEVDYAKCEVTQYRIGSDPWCSVWEIRTVTLKDFIDELRSVYLMDQVDKPNRQKGGE